jgi:hypothetical protein
MGLKSDFQQFAIRNFFSGFFFIVAKMEQSSAPQTTRHSDVVCRMLTLQKQ